MPKKVDPHSQTLQLLETANRLLERAQQLHEQVEQMRDKAEELRAEVDHTHERARATRLAAQRRPGLKPKPRSKRKS